MPLHRYRKPADGYVTGPDHRPAVGAPVFLDRGHGAIERFVTDSQGRFSLPISGTELRRATWMICVPGGIPMVSHDDGDGSFGAMTYGFTAQEPAKPTSIRARGWLGPIPRECPPAMDSVGWRYPTEAGKHPDAFTLDEPDWNSYNR